MRHRNSVKQLGRTHAHRKAMFSNMVTSFFRHERIVTTKEKGKELKRISERLITRAKKNIDLSDKQESRKLHNKREAMKVVKDRDVLKKLFEDIAVRFKDRNGGYTRTYLLGKRPGDAAEMSIVELVEKRIVEKKAEAKDKSEKKEEKKTEVKDEKKAEKKEDKRPLKKEEKKDKKSKKESDKDKAKKKSKKESKETGKK